MILVISLLSTASSLRAQATTSSSQAEKQPEEVHVTVKASPTGQSPENRAGSITVITADTFEQQGVITMGDVVRYEPLVSAPMLAPGGGNLWDGSGYSGYNIRGLEGNRVGLSIDGISMPAAAPRPDAVTSNGFGIGRDYLDPEMFRSAEIFSGTTPAAQDAGGLGGAVSFVTKSPGDYLTPNGRPVYVGYKIGYTSADEALAHTGTVALRLNPRTQALLVFTRRDGQETETKGTIAPDPIDWHSNALLGKLVWEANPGNKFTVTVDGFDRDQALTVANKVTATVKDVAQSAKTERWRVSGEHVFAPTAGLAVFDSLRTKIYYQDAKEEDRTHARVVTAAGAPNYTRDIFTALDTETYGLTADATKRIGDHHQLAYGLVASQEKQERPWTEDRTIAATGLHQITLKNRMADMTTTRVAAYLQDEFTFNLGGHRATLTPGLRAEYWDFDPRNLTSYIVAVPSAAKEITADSERYLAPSLSLLVGLTDKLNAYIQYNRGVRLPTPGEKTGTYDSFSYTGAGSGYAVFGNPDLKKETSDAFEAGLKGAPVEGVTFRAAAFYQQFDNYIEYAEQPLDPVNYPTLFLLYRPENIGKVEIYGAEFSARAELRPWVPALDGISLQASAGYSRGTTENTELGQRGWLPSIAPFKTSLTLGYDAPSRRYGIAAVTTYVDHKRAPGDVFAGMPGPFFRVPSYVRYDLSGYWRINHYATLNVALYNLGDKKYWDYAAVRGLSATSADIERLAQPGFNAAVSLSVRY